MPSRAAKLWRLIDAKRLPKADVPGVTGRLKMNAERNVDKPAVVQEVTFVNGEAKFVYKTKIGRAHV